MSSALDWRVSMTYESAGGTVAYEVPGDGPPVVLLHGTPSWSYPQRNLANQRAQRFTLHVGDLHGYGNSEKREGQDVSPAAPRTPQARFRVGP
jgi:pimeloyl-ACP methyl ester carboxylesterase